MARYLIIVNPVSGRGAGERSIPRLRELLTSLAIDFDLVRTERPMHAAELARSGVAQGYDVVVAAGGDGTSNEVINGLMAARSEGVDPLPALGVLCVGRGNDFAFGAGIPRELEAGCRALANGRRRKIDIGLVRGGLFPDGRFFGNGVGVGFDAVVGFEALKMKRLHGFASYIIAALKTIFLYFRAPLIRLEVDGQATTLPSLMVSIMNGRRMGGGFMMAPSGKADDGWFDLCVARQVSRGRILALIPRFMKGTQASHPAITMTRAREVRVVAVEGVLPAHADGETLCVQGRELHLKILPAQLDVIGEEAGR
jgi:YegS/Rv2252/BmrU family lipid kinase